MSKQHRRHFLRQLGGTTALMAAGPWLSKAASLQHEEWLTWNRPERSEDPIRFATIGMGIMGYNDTAAAVKVPGAQLVGVCDLYEGRLTHAKELYGDQIFTTRNYRDILDRTDIDAVLIATSDNWHDLISRAALERGKAVYCEKPMVQQIEYGQAVIDAQRKAGKPFQVGSQRVSSIVYEKAKSLYEAGKIGKVNMVQATYDRHSALGAWDYSIPPDASEQTIDFNTFLGRAPKVPFDPKRFFRWRNYKEYGTGIPGDLFVHLISGLHFITGAAGPTRIMASGGLRYWKDGRNVPDVMVAILDYAETEQHPGFQVTLQVNFVDGGLGEEGSETHVIGSEGALILGDNTLTLAQNPLPDAPGYGGWDSFGTFSEAMQQAYKKEYLETYGAPKAEMIPPQNLVYRAPRGYDEHQDHMQRFFDAIRGKATIVEDAVFGLRAAAPALACNMSYFEQRPIHWDPVAMKLV